MAKNSNRILIVDDDQNFRNVISNFFTSKNWNVRTAKDGHHAITALDHFIPDIILMDIKMPVMDGIMACKIIKNDLSMAREFPIIMMTALSDKMTIMKSVGAGCDDFILKPFKFEILLEKIEKFVVFTEETKRRVTLQEDDVHVEEAEAEIVIYSRQVIENTFSNALKGKRLEYPVIQKVTNKMIRILHLGSMLPMAFKMKAYSDYTFIHSVNVTALCLSFAYHLNWNERDLQILGEGALLHDIGKIKVDPKIILKPDKLTDQEYFEVMKHPQYGREIITEQNLRGDFYKIIIEHHEKLDGSGYPNNLALEQISKYGKISAIVDVYDALTTDRCYSKAIDSEAAIKIMDKEAKTFEPSMFAKFRALIKNQTIGK